MHSVALVTLAVLALATTDTNATCPTIITRAMWGARSPRRTTMMPNTPSFAVIHHSASRSCTDQSSCSLMVKNFQKQHMDVNNWSDIGYNFLIGGDGNVYEGVGWGRVGAHAPGYNTKGLGFCFIGTFTSGLPNSAALAAAHQMIDCSVTESKLKSDYKLIGHRQAKVTDCPGNDLYAHIQGWDHWKAV